LHFTRNNSALQVVFCDQVFIVAVSSLSKPNLLNYFCEQLATHLVASSLTEKVQPESIHCSCCNDGSVSPRRCRAWIVQSYLPGGVHM